MISKTALRQEAPLSRPVCSCISVATAIPPQSSSLLADASQSMQFEKSLFRLKSNRGHYGSLQEETASTDKLDLYLSREKIES
jgi:hypothetical protein